MNKYGDKRLHNFCRCFIKERLTDILKEDAEKYFKCETKGV